MSPMSPEVIAHRGASRAFHENTLAAFEEAARMGADAIELDVHRTADGVLVVHHDFHVTDAVDGRQLEIAGTPWEELKGLRLPGGEHVPTLDSVFDLAARRLKVYTEVKGKNCEALLAACLDRHPSVHHAVHSFDHRIPVAVRTLRPGTETGFLSTSYPVDLKGFMGDHPPDYFWQATELVDAELVTLASRLGVKVVAWTVNDAGDARTLGAMGVAGICTDVPDLMRSALSAGG